MKFSERFQRLRSSLHWTQTLKFVHKSVALLACSVNTPIHNSRFHLLAFASAHLVWIRPPSKLRIWYCMDNQAGPLERKCLTSWLQRPLVGVYFEFCFFWAVIFQKGKKKKKKFASMMHLTALSLLSKTEKKMQSCFVFWSSSPHEKEFFEQRWKPRQKQNHHKKLC